MQESLFEAVRTGDVEGAGRLAVGDALLATDAQGTTALMLAARLGNSRMVAALLAAGADVNAADALGFTPLFHACYNLDEDCGYPGVVQLLLDAGADKEAKIGYGVRPLMYAAGNGEAGVVEVLLRAGADPAARNEGGRTALMMVKDRDYVDVINLLHEAELASGGEGCGTRNAPGMQVVTFLKREK
ncbi:MAG TPA: ankyrin repeat domain-containing protein [Usitatibacteraceae bacterium]|nr:ankyrin repeat domain-containing protein [Usitatibacteraceae bacterium]